MTDDKENNKMIEIIVVYWFLYVFFVTAIWKHLREDGEEKKSQNTEHIRVYRWLCINSIFCSEKCQKNQWKTAEFFVLQSYGFDELILPYFNYFVSNEIVV